MFQFFLKDKNGSITKICSTLKEVSDLFGDVQILSENGVTELTMYLMNNYFHAEIDGMKYWFSGSTFNRNGYFSITFTQLD